MLTTERLKELLYYDKKSGHFKWRVKRRRILPGEIAGTCNKRGYIIITIDNHSYLAHRLAYFYVTGKWPKGLMDHFNCNKSDNKWKNLREIDKKLNAQNIRKATKRNTIGLLGVSPPQKGRTQFKATIQVNKKSIHLGYYKTAIQAHKAYIKAKRKLHIGGTL